MNKFNTNSKPLTWFMRLLLIAFVAGCGSGGDGGGGTAAQPGTLGVSMTDAPACGFDAVNVTVSNVRVHQSSSADDKAAGWTDITLDPPRTINLLDLNDPTQAPKFALESLGETPLAAGHYTQLRLGLVENNGNQPSANWIVLAGQDPITDKIPLETPSGIKSGLKLIHQFTVDSRQRVDLLLDFDACHSIVKTGSGKYKLKPVIKVIPFVLNGIEGFVDKNLLANNVIVSAQVNGEVVRATVPNTQTGKFFLAHLTPTNHDVVITADDHATAVISGVPVPSSTSITTVSTSGAPIPVVTSPALEASTTHSISGTVTLDPPPPPPTDEPTVFVAAKQTLVGGPKVTVKSLPATLLTVNPGDPRGDYEYNLLTLPIGVPSLGPYGALPIVFTRQPVPPSPDSVAGKYFVQASADGYIIQLTPSPVDISATNQTQNFILTP